VPLSSFWCWSRTRLVYPAQEKKRPLDKTKCRYYSKNEEWNYQNSTCIPYYSSYCIARYVSILPLRIRLLYRPPVSTGTIKIGCKPHTIPHFLCIYSPFMNLASCIHAYILPTVSSLSIFESCSAAMHHAADYCKNSSRPRKQRLHTPIAPILRDEFLEAADPNHEGSDEYQTLIGCDHSFVPTSEGPASTRCFRQNRDRA
jgi:hypothetical protein